MNEAFSLPAAWRGEQEEAVESLVWFLGRLTQRSYSFLDRPDESQRQKVAADYRYVCNDDGHLLAVEYKRFVKPEDQEAASHLAEGKRFREKGGVRPMERDGDQYGAISADDSRSDLAALRKLIVEAVGRGQLQNTEADERALLIEDRRYIPQELFSLSDLQIEVQERDGVDSAFVISAGSVGEKSVVFKVW